MAYKKTIKRLLNAESMWYSKAPIVSLIAQYMENELKAILQDYYEVNKTVNELGIQHHNLRTLIEKIENKYKKYIGIYGKDILINSRYVLNPCKLEFNSNDAELSIQEIRFIFISFTCAMKNIKLFYGIEKAYCKIINTTNPEERLNEFINDLKKDDSIVYNSVAVYILKRIDKLNKKILFENK